MMTPLIALAQKTVAGVLLTWTLGVQPPGVTVKAYRVYRSTNNSGYRELASGSNTVYKDKTAEKGNTYCYKVVAVSTAEETSAPSKPACVDF